MSTDTIVFPSEFDCSTPLFDELGFKQEELGSGFVIDCEQALITKGIGKNRCPTVPEWASLSVAGSIIATLTEKFIIPPDPEPFGWSSEMDLIIWQVLWQSFQDNQNKLEEDFMRAMLVIFIPEKVCAPPEKPYFISRFSYYWSALQYPDTIMHPIGRVRYDMLVRGEESFSRLSGEIQSSILEVAENTPRMLEIVNNRIRSTHLW